MTLPTTCIEQTRKAEAVVALHHPRRDIILNDLFPNPSDRYVLTQTFETSRTLLPLRFPYRYSARQCFAVCLCPRHPSTPSIVSKARPLVRSLLPLICGRHLSREDQQYAITQTAGLAADTSTITHHPKQPERALQHLEFGRGLILGYRRACVAFLSACSTDEVAATKFTDEAIHLASTFLVAGFAYEVASLWSVNDSVCADVAYHYLAQHPGKSTSHIPIADTLHAAVLYTSRNIKRASKCFRLIYSPWRLMI